MKRKTRNASVPLKSETSPISGGSRNASKSLSRNKRYYHYVIFIALIVSSYFNVQALWGLFFIGLTLPAYRNRTVFFLDMIKRDNEPIFYWAIFITWIAFGMLMVLGDWAVYESYINIQFVK